MKNISSCLECSLPMLQVQEIGSCAGPAIFTDDKGIYHNHDPNSYASTFKCAAGHEIVIHYKKGSHCCDCAF